METEKFNLQYLRTLKDYFDLTYELHKCFVGCTINRLRVFCRNINLYSIHFEFGACDISVATQLCISYLDYVETLVRDFNGKYDGLPFVYFTNKNDANRACEWANSVLVARKLI